MVEGIARGIIGTVARGIPPQGKDGIGASLGISFQYILQFLFRVSNTGKVGYGRDAPSLHIVDNSAGQLTGTSSGSVGDADKARVEFLELQDRIKKSLCPFWRFGRKELKRKAWRSVKQYRVAGHIRKAYQGSGVSVASISGKPVSDAAPG